MIDWLLIVVAAIAVLSGGALLWVFQRKTQLQQDLFQQQTLQQRAEQEAQNAVSQLEALQLKIIALEKDNTRLQTELEHVQAELAVWKTQPDSLWESKFLGFLQQTLKSTQAEVKTEATAEFTEKEKTLEAKMGLLMKPLTEMIERYKTDIEKLDRQTLQETASLKEQVVQLTQAKNQLVAVLKTNKGAGDWGEIQLQNILNFSGLRQGVDYDLQPQEPHGRPDAKIFLPGGRFIYVDAKTLQLTQADFTQPEDPHGVAQKGARALDSLKKAIKDLSSKAYTANLQGTPDFVVLFVPMESMLSLALDIEPHLCEEAAQKNIILSGPLNLVGLLKIIAYGWYQAELSSQAHEIGKLGKELHAQLMRFSERMVNVDTALGNVNKKFEEAKTAFQGQQGLIYKAKKLEAFGCKSEKSLPKELEGIELLTEGVLVEAETPLIERIETTAEEETLSTALIF